MVTSILPGSCAATATVRPAPTIATANNPRMIAVMSALHFS
jgi:hypothetical protein